MKVVSKRSRRGQVAVLLLLVVLAVPSAFAEDDDPSARVSPPGGVASMEPASSEEPTLLDLVWIWIATLV